MGRICNDLLLCFNLFRPRAAKRRRVNFLVSSTCQTPLSSFAVYKKLISSRKSFIIA